jgi:hypothetical protein
MMQLDLVALVSHLKDGAMEHLCAPPVIQQLWVQQMQQ